MKRGLLIVLPMVVALACSSSGNATPRPTATTPAEPTATQSRCEEAGRWQREAISAGIRDVAAANFIGQAFAVHSSDDERVWFVAAMIIGPGMYEGTGPGVWAHLSVSGEKDSPGLTLSVNGFAGVFSSYPDASGTAAQITMDDDGAREAEACALQNAAD